VITSASSTPPKNPIFCDCAAGTFADFPPDHITLGPTLDKPDRGAEVSNEFQMSFPTEGTAVETQQLPWHEQQQWVPTQQLQTTHFMHRPAPARWGTQPARTAMPQAG